LFKVKVLRTISDVDKATINDLSDDGFFTHEWFKVLEVSKPFKIEPRYFVAYDSGEAVAIAPCFIEHDSQYPTIEELSPWLGRLRKAGNSLGFSLNPPLVCHSPCSFHSKILIQKGYSKKTILDLLCKEIDESCKKDRILFSSFPFVSEFDETLMMGLADRGYAKVPFVETAYMEIKWTSFEDYLTHLGRKTRTNIRRELKKNRSHEIIIEQENDFHKLSGILSDLYSNLFMKYRGRRSPLHPLFFTAIGEHAKCITRLFIARKNGSVIGFTLCLLHKGVLDVYLAGFDYERLTKTDFTYFNTVFYAPIRNAIEGGFEKIHYRSASLEAKLSRGCRIEKSYLFIKCHVRPLNCILSQYARMKYKEKGANILPLNDL